MLSLLSHASAEIPDLPTQGWAAPQLSGSAAQEHQADPIAPGCFPGDSAHQLKELNSALMMACLQVLKASCGHRSPRHHQPGQDSDHQPPLPQQVRTTWSSHTTNIPTLCEHGLRAKIFNESLAGQAVKAQRQQNKLKATLERSPTASVFAHKSSLTQLEKPVTFPACGST